MAPSDQLQASPEWYASVGGWLRLWGVSELERDLQIRVSTRLRTSVARCLLARPEIRLASFLVDAPQDLVLEVLCHEAAHAAVVALHGRRVRPHGAEWRGLMHSAGFRPRVRLPSDELAGLPRITRRARVLWEHRCPVCQAHRFAGRPVRQWCCAACRAEGLRGRLHITRVSAAPGSAD